MEEVKDGNGGRRAGKEINMWRAVKRRTRERLEMRNGRSVRRERRWRKKSRERNERENSNMRKNKTTDIISGRRKR